VSVVFDKLFNELGA